MIRFQFVNNGGGGLLQYVNVAEGTKVVDYVKKVLGDPSGYKIRYNSEDWTEDQVIEEGSRISVTPSKIEGGR